MTMSPSNHTRPNWIGRALSAAIVIGAVALAILVLGEEDVHPRTDDQQVFTLIDTRTWWAVANFREDQLRHIPPGAPADVYVMSKPNERFLGIVESAGFGVTPDPEIFGSFEKGLPDVQRTLNWVRLAARYPVRIRVRKPLGDLFRISESAVVVIRGR